MKSGKIRLLCALALVALLFSCACLPAVTEEAKDGWLSITIGSGGSGDFKGVHMAIYLLATGDYGDWTMVDAFSDIKVYTRGDGSASVDMTLSQIRRRISERKIKPAAKEYSDAKGKVEFKNLTHGIYYAEMIDGPEGLIMSPMLLAIPNKTGNVKVRALAKYVYETPTPAPTNTPAPSHVPTLPPEPEESIVPIDDYEAALGLTNIQMHVGVCFE